MKKLSLLSVVFLAASLFTVGCTMNDGTEGDQAAAKGENRGCHWKCNQCRPGSLCVQTCEQVGNCGSRCNIIALCVEGYIWNDQKCQCEPEGETCGFNICGPGQVCCNASCGICTEPGGFCTMQACEPLTETM